jgi:hypothetical protein
MTDLPQNTKLDIRNLSRCFKSVTNAYKYYWFLSILDHLAESDDLHITLDEISMRMLSLVWYPLDYYKLSFGKHDGFKELAATISAKITIDNAVNAPSLLYQIEHNLKKETAAKLKHKVKKGLDRWVKFRFLSPFFEDSIKGLPDQQVNIIISRMSNSSNVSVPYSIEEKGIMLNEEWAMYFQQHQIILRSFVNWHLVRFLQKNNPNVIGLTEKLEKPLARDLKLAKTYWSKFLADAPFKCIYSNLEIARSNFSLDHFIPWSYIAHDQLWNIIPTTKSANSSKSDCLPSLKTYLDSFCAIQFQAFRFHISLGHDKLLEDYNMLFNDYDLTSISQHHFNQILSIELSNHCRIAENLGFKASYKYDPKPMFS